MYPSNNFSFASCPYLTPKYMLVGGSNSSSSGGSGDELSLLFCQGRTRVYAKSGVMVRQFPSMLPGGNRRLHTRGFAMLDCIWSEVNKTYYILDLVMWLNQPIIECEVSCVLLSFHFSLSLKSAAVSP